MAKRARTGKKKADAPPPPPNRGATAVPNPPAEAVTLFETGLKAVQRHEYERGAQVLNELITNFEDERALLDRARVYLDLCQRELAQRTPRTIEERMTAATAALNDDDEHGAEQLALEILAEQPKHDLALYLLAAIACRRGQQDRALDYLRQAIDLSPEAAAQARLDDDFEPLFELDAFVELTDVPPVTDVDTH